MLFQANQSLFPRKTEYICTSRTLNMLSKLEFPLEKLENAYITS